MRMMRLLLTGTLACRIMEREGRRGGGMNGYAGVGRVQIVAVIIRYVPVSLGREGRVSFPLHVRLGWD
jgi:hypothetical protein